MLFSLTNSRFRMLPQELQVEMENDQVSCHLIQPHWLHVKLNLDFRNFPRLWGTERLHPSISQLINVGDPDQSLRSQDSDPFTAPQIHFRNC